MTLTDQAGVKVPSDQPSSPPRMRANRALEGEPYEAQHGLPPGPETHASAQKNAGGGRRMASLAGGSLLVLVGLKRGGLMGLALAGLGGSLVYRGATGNCSACGRMT